MNQEKVGLFIKDIRKKNGLTQKQFADKLGVTYQAVSKWENGLNLPEISILKQISSEFNVSIENILDGNKESSKKINFKIGWIIVIIFVISLISLFFILNSNHNKESFNFKTISTDCSEFNVSGSLAYDRYKSSIYISNINYCGGNDETIYQEIECNLYERNDNTNTIISSCKSEKDNIKLEDYLKNIKLNIDNYTKTCKNYTENSLFLEINAKDKNNKITTYKIPLNIKDNCPK